MCDKYDCIKTTFRTCGLNLCIVTIKILLCSIYLQNLLLEHVLRYVTFYVGFYEFPLVSTFMAVLRWVSLFSFVVLGSVLLCSSSFLICLSLSLFECFILCRLNHLRYYVATNFVIHTGHLVL